ncbi:hypothetical protein BHE74_00033940 [Ensete ventricosum]|nr:hypothetical protein GW17_00011409 [Ensete ventricosum]RWW59142.1 hypothetical protein BHE74_00033940 [Ensete ventricosum]RZR98167.1 hypothetical protein BHM03_00027481 [Ensete ventricosum]
MKNSWNDMIPLLPLQEFMSLTYVSGKLYASAPYSIFYVDSLHATWILHQVSPKLLCSSICIELMVALTPTIPRVNPPLNLISTSTLCMPSYKVVIVAPPLDFTMHPPMYYLMQDYAITPRHLLGLLRFIYGVIFLRCYPQYVRSVAYDSPSREPRLIPPGYLSYCSNFSLRILHSRSFKNHHPLGLPRLLNNLCIILPP